MFCRKVLVSQRDEIELMQTWLKDRGQSVPDPNEHHMSMPGMDMGSMPMMPGHAHAEQMKALDQARGAEFDASFSPA